MFRWLPIQRRSRRRPRSPPDALRCRIRTKPRHGLFEARNQLRRGVAHRDAPLRVVVAVRPGYFWLRRQKQLRVGVHAKRARVWIGRANTLQERIVGVQLLALEKRSRRGDDASDVGRIDAVGKHNERRSVIKLRV